MNCVNCEAYMEDLQTGDHYCRELKALISPGAVKCLPGSRKRRDGQLEELIEQEKRIR